MSVIAWLDTSADEERRMRELIKLLSDSDTLDDLGVGQIRDAFGDLLFPGISTIQTRARYLLFVPWTYQQSARTREGSELAAHAANEERRIVETMDRAKATDGLIGKRAGVKVKTLPSTIYWTALKAYGILRTDVRPSGLQQIRRTRSTDDSPDDPGTSDWAPGIPSAVEGFPKSIPEGFDLKHDEAEWLREQMVKATPHQLFEDSLLKHLLRRASAPDPAWDAPWDVDDLDSAPSELRELIRHAEMFSLVIQGARLLYNLMLAERYQELGFDALDSPADFYREELTDWATLCENRRTDLAAWRVADLWPLVQLKAPRISPATRDFVDAWVDAVKTQDCHGISSDPTLRKLVSDREFHNKRAQSRLRNEKLLGMWKGASGRNPMVFRWFQASRIVTDIFEGLNRADA